MPVISRARTDWFPPGSQFPSTTTLSPVNSNYVVLFLRHTWNGLALFAILVIVEKTVRKISARRRRKNNTTNIIPPTNTECHWQYPPPSQDTAAHLQEKSAVSSPPFFEPHQVYQLSPSAPRPSRMMAGHSGDRSGSGHVAHSVHQGPSISDGQPGPNVGPGQEGSSRAPGDGAYQGHIIARPPLPPLTPAAPAQPPVFAPEHGVLGASLMHQPNPDYLSHTAPSSQPSDEPPLEASRNPHSRTIPVSIPTPPPLRARHSDSTTSSDEGHFSSRSFPSSTPFLPPPPPAFDDRGKSVDVQAEVISVTDGFGAGWTRHTRVYGGGVCLACAASGGEGGFYGATALRPERS
ncbi:hypothetical protein VUR80DRAFT_5307 [Thermomyces stellatus]